jgi:RNA polymerase sigma-70 factor, ECF subfamily
MGDGELVRQALAGRMEAYAELVRRWAARITALCHAKTGHADAADDLAQEVLLRGYRSLTALADPDKFGAWLWGIAHRTCLDWLKRQGRAPVPFSSLGPDHDPEEYLTQRSGQGGPPDVDHEDEVRHLLAEVEALPAECRQVVMLYYYEDTTYRELGQLLGVSSATINARLTRARSLLRERLSGCRR